MRSLRSKFGRAFGVSQARATYAVLADVNKFASDSEHYSGKFYFFIFLFQIPLKQNPQKSFQISLFFQYISDKI